LLSMLLFFMRGEIGFESLGQFAPGKHDAPSTAFAFQPDIRAEPRDDPFIGAAGMLFTQSQVIVELQVREHNQRDESERIITIINES
jgi:hypothetical protein